jgi:hypothetical protein
MTENVDGMIESRPMSRWTEYKYRLAIAAPMALMLGVGMASAAINFTPISELLQAVIALLPDFMDLMVGVAPIIVLGSLLGFIIKFWDKILAMLNF